MSLALEATSESSGQIEIGGEARLIFPELGGAKLPQSPTLESDPKSVATLENVLEYGGMPRFHAFVSTARAGVGEPGCIESSGQQTLDLMFPTMRADVIASQPHCTETEWQADPYKRVTHWSLGDGVSWMRPPDKNGVQPGNVGAFYGVGSNPAGALTGTAVIDAMRNLTGRVSPTIGTRGAAWLGVDVTTGVFGAEVKDATGTATITAANTTGGVGFDRGIVFNASKALPPGTTTDPLTGEFRPRTWYGIWMIRMYGRVVNTGLLDAPALNARMDMIDSRVSTLEGREMPLGQGQTWENVQGERVLGAWVTNDTNMTLSVSVTSSAIPSNSTGDILKVTVLQDGVQTVIAHFNITNSAAQRHIYSFPVPSGASYKVESIQEVATWTELRG